MNLTLPDHQKMQKSTDLLDQKLVARVQKGDRSAFDLLLVKYQNRVASIISRYIDRQEDIEDLTQEVFIKVFRAIHTYRGESSFYTWLFRIAINHAKSFLQQRKTKPNFQDKRDIGFEKNSNQGLLTMDTPENLLSRSELVETIKQTFASMPSDLNVALMLREFDGLSYDEISKVMECPIGTVRSRIYRARELLDSALQKQACSI